MRTALNVAALHTVRRGMSVFHTEQSTLNKMFPDVKRSIEIAGDTKQFLVLVIIFWGGGDVFGVSSVERNGFTVFLPRRQSAVLHLRSCATSVKLNSLAGFSAVNR